MSVNHVQAERKITGTEMADLTAAFRPTAKNVTAMVNWMLVKWGWKELGLLTGISQTHLREMQAGKFRPPESDVRLIWLYYMLDVAPEKLREPLYLATWGKGVDATRMNAPKRPVPEAA